MKNSSLRWNVYIYNKKMERNFVKDIYMSLEYFVCSKAGYKANKSIDVVVFLVSTNFMKV
jgi:hypothetical protein